MTDLPFRQGVARTFGVGGVGEQGQDALVAIGGKTVQISGGPGGGGAVDLEIAGVDEDPHGGGQGKADPVHNAVGHVDKVKGKVSEHQRFPGLEPAPLHLPVQPVFLQFLSEQGQGQGRAVNRDLDLFEQEGHGADMILMTMGQDQGRQFVLMGPQVGEIRDDHVDAQHVVFREHDAGIDEDHGPGGFEDHGVEADFPQTAQKNQIHPVIFRWGGSRRLHRLALDQRRLRAPDGEIRVVVRGDGSLHYSQQAILIPQPVCRRRNGRAEDHFDGPRVEAPSPLGPDMAAAAEAYRHDGPAGFDGQDKAAFFKGEEAAI